MTYPTYQNTTYGVRPSVFGSHSNTSSNLISGGPVQSNFTFNPNMNSAQPESYYVGYHTNTHVLPIGSQCSNQMASSNIVPNAALLHNAATNVTNPQSSTFQPSQDDYYTAVSTNVNSKGSHSIQRNVPINTESFFERSHIPCTDGQFKFVTNPNHHFCTGGSNVFDKSGESCFATKNNKPPPSSNCKQDTGNGGPDHKSNFSTNSLNNFKEVDNSSEMNMLPNNIKHLEGNTKKGHPIYVVNVNNNNNQISSKTKREKKRRQKKIMRMKAILKKNGESTMLGSKSFYNRVLQLYS